MLVEECVNRDGLTPQDNCVEIHVESFYQKAYWESHDMSREGPQSTRFLFQLDILYQSHLSCQRRLTSIPSRRVPSEECAREGTVVRTDRSGDTIGKLSN